MQKKVRSACLFVIAILIGIAPTVGGIKSDVLFWCCIGLSAVLAIIAIGTLDPAYALLFREACGPSRRIQFQKADAKLTAAHGENKALSRLSDWRAKR
jgi:hypothetical protein